MELPPNVEDVLPSLNDGIELLTSLVENSLSDLRAEIEKLTGITDEVEEFHRKATIGSLSGGLIGAAGGLTSLAGLALAPFTLGASLSLTAAGTGVALLGGATAATSNISDMINQKNSREKIETSLNEFKKKLSPITECLQNIQLNLDKIQQQQEIQVLIKAAGGIAGAILLDVVDDIARAALNVSKSLGRVAAISGVISGLAVILDVYFIVRDAKELYRINNKQTDSSASETLQFIQKMRETIKTLEEMLDDINSTKESLQNLTRRQ